MLVEKTISCFTLSVSMIIDGLQFMNECLSLSRSLDDGVKQWKRHLKRFRC